LQSNRINAAYLNEEASLEDPHETQELRLAQKEWLQFNHEHVLMCKILFETLKRFPSETQNAESLYFTSPHNFIEFYCKLARLVSSRDSFVDTAHFGNLRKLLLVSSATTVDEIVNALVNLIVEACLNHPKRKTMFQASFLDEIEGLLNFLLEYQSSSKKSRSLQTGKLLKSKDDTFSDLKKRAVERRGLFTLIEISRSSRTIKLKNGPNPIY
jgi:hypothetical protein